MAEILTQSIQDYLKNIYELSANGGPVSTNDLAHRLDISAASVTGMVQRLASTNPPLVTYKKHQGVTLTSQGERAALEVIRHHRLIETYLVQALGYSWDEVHEEACRLEHVISENFEERIAMALGNPSHDPHGDPIPSADLTMPDEHFRVLFTLRPGAQAQIVRVNNEDPAFLRHIEELGLVPGATVSVKEYSEFDDNLTLDVAGRTIVIGPSISREIFVSEAL
jgi:DtxR family Mn-dependent transcriptional regulator